ncbi:hypothetical protein [Xanthomonas sacchari]|uniref:hypothetical protein n=1 Tax=Xanthomonas sacchari TaxID=56458 RepID=UPI003B20C09D
MNALFLLPPATAEVAQVIGVDASLTLAGQVFQSRDRSADAKPGGCHGRLYVPRKARGRNYERLTIIIGNEAARKLVAAFGGTELRFGRCKVLADRVRDASIRGHWREGTLSAYWIGWLHGVGERQVRNVTAGEPRLAYADRSKARSTTHAAA